MWKCSSFDNICQTRNKEGITLGKFFIDLSELVYTKKQRFTKRNYIVQALTSKCHKPKNIAILQLCVAWCSSDYHKLEKWVTKNMQSFNSLSNQCSWLHECLLNRIICIFDRHHKHKDTMLTSGNMRHCPNMTGTRGLN